MHEFDRPGARQPASGEVLTSEGYVEAVYGKLGIETALGSYLDGNVQEEDVSVLLAGFSESLADAAMTDGSLDTETVRFGFDHLTRNMNAVCSRRFGYEDPKTLREALRIRIGVDEPRPGRYVRGLDERYWAVQFPEEYTEEKLVQRKPGESEQAYLGRHIGASIHGLIFSYFTHMR